MNRPNILWICTDHQRFDTLGCMGNSWVQTPHLNALAARGALFDHAFCQAPICTPSRASFLTGRYPRTTRTRQNGQNLPDDEVLVTKLLAAAGYSCGLVGKLHVRACNPRVAPVSEPRGDDGYGAFYWTPDDISFWAGADYGMWLRERGLTMKREPFENSRFVELGMSEEHRYTAWCAERATNFIEHNAEQERPWLFSVNIFDPHFPFDPSREMLERYLDRLDEIPLPNFVPGELDDKPPFQKSDHERGAAQNKWQFQDMTERDHRLLRAAFWAMCDSVDLHVGRILESLEKSGQRDNTLVIFTSDHGEMLGDHGLYLKGPYFYDPAVRVPLIISGPNVAPGRRKALVELTDLAPTLLESVGLPISPAMQGRSLAPLLSGATDASRDDVYCEYLNGMPVHEPAVYATMLRTPTHKIVRVHGQDVGELYDLEADPSETRNLWDDPQSAALKCELTARLCDRIAFTADPLPPRLAPF